MKRAILMGTVLIAASTSVGHGTFAQPRRGGGPGMYDPKTVETISGQVVSVERIAGKGGGRGQGVHLTVKTDKGKIAVHLGPSWYLEKQGITFSAHDQVEVHGSRVTYDGKPAVIAASITKGEQTLTLRDAQGLPQWRGQGRRGR